MQEKYIFQIVPEQEKHRLSRAFGDVAWTCSRVEPRKEHETLSLVMLRCESLTWLQPAIQSTTSPWSAVNLKKNDLDKVQLEPAIWLCYTGQRMPCFDRCHLTITLMSNIKDVCCKLARVSTELEP